MDLLDRAIGQEEALDILAIQRCLAVAVMGNDMLDSAMWKSAYWPDATEDHGWYLGNAHQFIDETIPMLVGDMDMTWHAVGVPLVMVDGDTARSIAQFTGYVRLKAADGAVPNDLLCGGRYIDRLERRDGVWRISHRVSKGDWTRIDPASYEWGQPGMGGFVPQMGLRAADDPAKELFAGWPGPPS